MNEENTKKPVKIKIHLDPEAADAFKWACVNLPGFSHQLREIELRDVLQQATRAAITKALKRHDDVPQNVAVWTAKGE